MTFYWRNLKKKSCQSRELLFVFQGANKAFSNETNTETYECGYEGKMAYYQNTNVFKLHLHRFCDPLSH